MRGIRDGDLIIDAVRILPAPTSQPSQPSRVSKLRIWPRRPDRMALIFAVGLRRTDDLHGMIRLEQHRAALRQRLDDADAARDAECHVGRVRPHGRSRPVSATATSTTGKPSGRA